MHTVSVPTLSPADAHARMCALLSIRAGIANHAHNLATLAEGLADGYLQSPTERVALDRIATAADATIRNLVALIAAERHISPMGV